MDYRTIITTHRAYNPIDDLDYSVESDRGRVLSSAAFRRLQKRTQVFALELNASIRTRLTHSLEVAQTARFIAKTILSKISQKDDLARYGLDGLQNAFVSTVETASFLHDIGNPPFGHFGEATLSQYIRQHYVPILRSLSSSDSSDKENHSLIRDISEFEGNAQAVRIVTKLQRMNLSYSQTLAIVKYTRGAFEQAPQKDEKLAYLRKKAGYYFGERRLIEHMRDSIAIKPYHRFALTYIMEAADDIAYLTADLEDAVDKGVIGLETLYERIVDLCNHHGERFLKTIVEKQFRRAKENDAPYRFNMFFTLLRAELIGTLVRYVADLYLQHHESIFEGSLNASLLTSDSNGQYHLAVSILQTISRDEIYRSKTVQELELQGYSVLTGLLNLYQPLIDLSYEDFSKLLEGERIDSFVAEGLLGRISSKQLATYRSDLLSQDLKGSFDERLWERYLRMRMVLDYISGMTDDYALYEYQRLGAMQ